MGYLVHNHCLKIFLVFLVPVIAYAGDVDVELNSNDGSTVLDVKDSDGTSVYQVDSDGNMVIKGGLRLDVGGVEHTTAENLIVDGKVGIGTTNPTVALTVNGGVSRYGFFYAYQKTAPITIGAATWTVLNLDSVEVLDTEFYTSIAGGVQIKIAGLYRITIAGDYAATGGTREFAQIAAYVDGSRAPDITSSMYFRETAGIDGTGTSRTGLKQVGVNENIELYFYTEGGDGDPKSYGSSLLIEFLR